MQDVTNEPFWRLGVGYGCADAYWTEYFRVHSASRLHRRILESITKNPTGRPVVAQIIGNDIPALVRTARELQEYPVAAVDLNLGCPAPVVYRKCAGGGLLRDLDRVNAIVGSLREVVRIKFTVKTRIGFDSPSVFEDLLSVFAKHSLDLLTVHGRTVKQMYRLPVHYDRIRQAVISMPCPVLANGHVYAADQALEVLAQTGAHGVMIGRGAIRNPWLFEQIRQRLRGETPSLPVGRAVLEYIRALWESVSSPVSSESARVQRLKKFMNFIGEGVEPADLFLHKIRRAETKDDFFRVCEEFLDHDRPMELVPSAEPTSAQRGDECG